MSISTISLKISIIQIVGCLIGRGTEMALILIVFCTFRLQAGGSHSNTEVGCTLSMMGICFISLFGGRHLLINNQWLWIIYLSILTIVLIYAPKTINLKYFTKRDIIRKKNLAVLFLTIVIMVGKFNPGLRAFIVCPIILEAVTLLPEYKIIFKRGGKKS